MANNPPKNPSGPGKSVNIKISDDVQKGVYANKLIVAHSADEFVLDFVADFPPGAQIVSRVISSPRHLAAIVETLKTNLERYEAKHGSLPRRASGSTPTAQA